jgi:hypothetical protein
MQAAEPVERFGMSEKTRISPEIYVHYDLAVNSRTLRLALVEEYGRRSVDLK